MELGGALGVACAFLGDDSGLTGLGLGLAAAQLRRLGIQPREHLALRDARADIDVESLDAATLGGRDHSLVLAAHGSDRERFAAFGGSRRGNQHGARGIGNRFLAAAAGGNREGENGGGQAA